MGDAYVTLILAAVGGLDDQTLAAYLFMGGAKLGKIDVVCPRVETRGCGALPRFHDTVEFRFKTKKGFIFIKNTPIFFLKENTFLRFRSNEGRAKLT
jgi:hypothetical protein